MIPSGVKRPTEAQKEIAEVILNRSLDGTLKWVRNNNVFECQVNELLTARLFVAGIPEQAERWDNFDVRQGPKMLVDYYYPTAANTALGHTVAPSEIKVLLDKFLGKLLQSVFDATYGRALASLKDLR